MMMVDRFVIAALALVAAGTAAAQEPAPVRADDRVRLDGLDASVGAGLRQVLASGDDAQVAAATEALRGEALPLGQIDVAALAGDWSCRMTKVGGLLPAVAYPPFRCRIGDGPGGPVFEKLTGSQRTRGTLHRDGDRWIYLGSTFVAGEEPRDYADFLAEIDLTGSETLPDVALVEVLATDALRLVFPAPYRESLVNVLSLSR